MDQNFNDPVNQVAGRDIINYVSRGLTEMDLTEKQLNTVIKQETALAKVAWKEMAFHPYNIAVTLLPFLSLSVMIAAVLSPYLSYYLIISILGVSIFSFQYCYRQNQVLVQGEIGRIYRQTKMNINDYKDELTRRRLDKKVRGKNQF